MARKEQGLLAERLWLGGGLRDAVAALNGDLAEFGLVAVGLFALSWPAPAAIYWWIWA
jgi:hypothetical protein